jgi:hypothetical protein
MAPIEGGRPSAMPGMPEVEHVLRSGKGGLMKLDTMKPNQLLIFSIHEKCEG